MQTMWSFSDHVIIGHVIIFLSLWYTEFEMLYGKNNKVKYIKIKINLIITKILKSTFIEIIKYK